MTFDAKDDAVAWLSARRAEIEMEVWAPEVARAGCVAHARCRRFQAYADLWLETARPRAASCARRPAGSTGCSSTSSSTRPSATSRIDQISTEASTPGTTPSRPGRETIRAQSYSLLRTIFASAASERPHPLIPYNPAHIRGAGNTKRAHHVQPASLDELRIIVEELPDRYKLMALLAAWCAMRFGELAELRRGDIDLRTNRVKIRRGVVRVDGEFIVGPPKSRRGRAATWRSRRTWCRWSRTT